MKCNRTCLYSVTAAHLLGDLSRDPLEQRAQATLQRPAAPARTPHVLTRALQHPVVLADGRGYGRDDLRVRGHALRDQQECTLAKCSDHDQ